ncbi:MAG: sortase [Clostridia bacterium]|nr:sortase [Clostridia bacterium]
MDLQLTDQILTLATCAYDFDDARLIVHAKRVN